MSTELVAIPRTTEGIDIPSWCRDHHLQAATLLALGKGVTEVARELEVSRTAVYKWLSKPDFVKLVNELTMTVGLADNAERIRRYKERADSLWDREGLKPSKKHDWLDYARAIAEETAPFQAGKNPLVGTLIQVFADGQVNIRGDDVIEAEVAEIEEAPSGDD